MAILLAAVLLVVSAGRLDPQGRRADEPRDRPRHRARVGRPAAWMADQLPFAGVSHAATAWLSPNPSLKAPRASARVTATAASAGTPVVTPEAFDPAAIGAKPPPQARPAHAAGHRRLDVEPLDSDLARLLGPKGVHVIQDPHVGTGISNTLLVDWGKLAALSGPRRPPGRRRHLHRRQRGLPDARPGRTRGRMLQHGTGPPSTPTACARWPTPTARTARRASTG